MSNRREYTIQYLIDYDWHRITAVYDSLEDVMNHAILLLAEGMICRVLARYRNTDTWYTIKTNSDNDITLENPTTCPK